MQLVFCGIALENLTITQIPSRTELNNDADVHHEHMKSQANDSQMAAYVNAIKKHTSALGKPASQRSLAAIPEELTAGQSGQLNAHQAPAPSEWLECTYCGKASWKWMGAKFNKNSTSIPREGSVSTIPHIRLRCSHDGCHQQFTVDARTIGRKEAERRGGFDHGEHRKRKKSDDYKKAGGAKKLAGVKKTGGSKKASDPKAGGA